MVQPVQQQPINLVEPPPVQQEYYGVPPVVPATRVSDVDDAFMSPPPVEPEAPMETYHDEPEAPTGTQPVIPEEDKMEDEVKVDDEVPMEKDLTIDTLTAERERLQKENQELRNQLNSIPSIESKIAQALAGGDIQVSSASRPAKRTAPGFDTKSTPLPKRQKVQGRRPPTTTTEESYPPDIFPPPPKASEKVRTPDYSNIIDPDARKIAEENVKYADEKGFPRPIKFENTGEISKKSRLNIPYWKKATRKLAD